MLSDRGMDRLRTLLRSLIGCLMLVAIMTLALHTGEMVERADAAVAMSHAEAAPAPDGNACGLSAAHDDRHPGHDKLPCKSACCGAACAATLPPSAENFACLTGSVRRPEFADSPVLEDRSVSGIMRPPRPSLDV